MFQLPKQIPPVPPLSRICFCIVYFLCFKYLVLKNIPDQLISAECTSFIWRSATMFTTWRSSWCFTVSFYVKGPWKWPTTSKVSLCIDVKHPIYSPRFIRSKNVEKSKKIERLYFQKDQARENFMSHTTNIHIIHITLPTFAQIFFLLPLQAVALFSKHLYSSLLKHL